MANIVFDDGNYAINQTPQGTYDVWERWDDRVFFVGNFRNVEKAFNWVAEQGSVGSKAYYDYLGGK